MSENQDSTSTSVAGRLRAAGFKETTIARAVREYIESLLGVPSNMGTNLSKAIGETNAAHLAVLETPEIIGNPSVVAANDAVMDIPKKAA